MNKVWMHACMGVRVTACGANREGSRTVSRCKASSGAVCSASTACQLCSCRAATTPGCTKSTSSNSPREAAARIPDTRSRTCVATSAGSAPPAGKPWKLARKRSRRLTAATPRLAARRRAWVDLPHARGPTTNTCGAGTNGGRVISKVAAPAGCTAKAKSPGPAVTLGPARSCRKHGSLQHAVRVPRGHNCAVQLAWAGTVSPRWT